MHSEYKKQMLIVVMVVGILLVPIICILSLIMIWSSDDNTEVKEEVQKELGVGEYIFTNVSEEDAIKKYFSEIFAELLSENYTELYYMLDNDYIAKTGYKLEDFDEKIKLMSISGKNLTLTNYETFSFKGEKIIILNIETIDGSVEETLIIKEKTPGQYKLSLDGLIYYSNENKIVQKEGIKITFKDIVYSLDEVTLNVNVQNLSNDVVYLNSTNLQEAIYIQDSLGNLLTPKEYVFGGKQITLNNLDDVHLNLKYDLEYSQYNDINILLLKNIKYNSGITKDLEFNIW